MWLINPTFWLIFLIVEIGLLTGAYTAGSKHASSSCIADQAQEQQAAQAKVDKTNTRREAVAQSRETSREQIRVVYRTIKEKAHENPVVTDCGLDADGLRLWNAANAGNPATLFGKLDCQLPGAAADQVGTDAGSAGQPHRGDGAVQPVQGSTGETGGVQP